MSSLLLLVLVLAVSAFDIDIDALFSGADIALLNHAGRGYGNGTMTLLKRYDQARFTFYAAGLGACGTTNTASDFIVALNSPQYGNGEHCYEMIEITYDGKSTQAQIVDECPGCPWGALDFSTGLFDYFASESLGVIYGSWVFSGTNTTTQQTPGPTTMSSQSSKASANTDSLTSSPTASQPTTTSTPTPTSTSGSAGQLEQLELAFGSVLGLIVAAGSE
ncbi:RlpA-like double-psi beta-barrel-protein domain-containing protein-containing protein [Mycena maculata]|uniref:RlpA-like double-psi beta-barrel-protein domain-containing protein-containing protein n=1 Tax=Mycena maculata TaxID=230809 RepID=A0AAD7IC82_9AGAR|nr:RlpA-like double-psi beta-barrel-protein domain-containing protein-containing protein [Mycena maculata]